MALHTRCCFFSTSCACQPNTYSPSGKPEKLLLFDSVPFLKGPSFFYCTKGQRKVCLRKFKWSSVVESVQKWWNWEEKRGTSHWISDPDSPRAQPGRRADAMVTVMGTCAVHARWNCTRQSDRTGGSRRPSSFAQYHSKLQTSRFVIFAMRSVSDTYCIFVTFYCSKGSPIMSDRVICRSSFPLLSPSLCVVGTNPWPDCRSLWVDRCGQHVVKTVDHCEWIDVVNTL